MKILTVLGARPQFIKAGAVSRAIKKVNSGGVIVDNDKVIVDSDSGKVDNKLSLNTITEVIVHTVQPVEMRMDALQM